MTERLRQFAALVIVTVIEPGYMLLDALTRVAEWLYPMPGDED